jgi:uncharacterized protein (TIGR04141 family)
MARRKDTTNRITVYRLKEKQDLATVSVSGFDKVAEGPEAQTAFEYILWFGDFSEYTPTWYPPFRKITSTAPVARQSGFVLLLNTSNATYGCTGGLGFHKLLECFKIEPRFGITLAKKVMAMVNLKGLVQKDASGIVNNLDRVFRGTYNPQGDIDNLHRVLTNIRASFQKGSEKYTEIGASIRAGDSLAANGAKDFSEIFSFIKRIDELWNDDDQGLSIPELEHINPRHEKPLIDKLNQVLACEILQCRTNDQEERPNLFLDNIGMGYLPDRVVQYTIIHHRNQHDFSTYQEVFQKLAEVLAECDGEDDLLYTTLESVRIKLTFDDDFVNKPKPILQYICGDVVLNNEAYFINNGLWFKANANFIGRVNAELDEVLYLSPDKFSLQEWNSTEDESAYNSKHAGSVLVVLDRHLIRIQQESGPIEFCDLLYHQEDNPVAIIHVKKATGAALRALFAQGYVSAQLYSESDEFRQKVHTAQVDGSDDLSQQDKNELAALAQRHKRDLRIVYAIYDNTPSHSLEDAKVETVTEALGAALTLFAKIDLLGRVQAVRSLGYDVAMTRIKPYPIQV